MLISARREARLIQTPVYNEQFLKFTRLIPVNADNVHFSVSRGTDSAMHCQPLLLTDTDYLRTDYFPFHNHVLIVNIVNCSKNEKFCLGLSSRIA